MLLNELPYDILTTLPSYLYSFQDLSSVLLTCRSLYSACCSPTSAQIKRLSEHGFYSQPHLLTAIKARKLANWAVEKAHPERREVLCHAISAGPSGLLELVLEVEPLSLCDFLRASWVERVVLGPVIEMLDAECGLKLRDRWRRKAADGGSKYYERYFREREPEYVGELSDEEDHIADRCCKSSVRGDIGLVILNYWIYCDLFYHAIAPPSIFSPDNAGDIEPLSDGLQFNWFDIFIPDKNMFNELNGGSPQLDFKETLPYLYPKLHQALAKDGRGFGDGSAKQTWFYMIASHLGLASLRLLIPTEGGDRFPKEIQRIKNFMEDKLDERFLEGLWGGRASYLHIHELMAYGGDFDDIHWAQLHYDIRKCLGGALS